MEEHLVRFFGRIFFAVFVFFLGFFAGSFLVLFQVRAMAAEGSRWDEPEAVDSGSLKESGEPGTGTAEEKFWFETLLVNAQHPFEGPAPSLETVEGSYQLDACAAQALKEMLEAGRAQGLKLKICSAYRSRERQSSLFEKKVQQYLAAGWTESSAREEAAQTVARPGTSEHETGLAVDLVSEDYQLLDEGQERTKEQQWLMENCSNYGFILRYPTGKTDITGIIYEPWHYRYVGVRIAREIMDQGICLEEYLKEQEDR